jgi:hypothetical protein
MTAPTVAIARNLCHSETAKPLRNLLVCLQHFRCRQTARFLASLRNDKTFGLGLTMLGTEHFPGGGRIFI